MSCARGDGIHSGWERAGEAGCGGVLGLGLGRVSGFGGGRDSTAAPLGGCTSQRRVWGGAPPSCPSLLRLPGLPSHWGCAWTFWLWLWTWVIPFCLSQHPALCTVSPPRHPAPDTAIRESPPPCSEPYSTPRGWCSGSSSPRAEFRVFQS